MGRSARPADGGAEFLVSGALTLEGSYALFTMSSPLGWEAALWRAHMTLN